MDCKNLHSTTDWSCSQCTYRHELPHEQSYLACVICGSPRRAIIDSEVQQKSKQDHFFKSQQSLTTTLLAKKASTTTTRTHTIIRERRIPLKRRRIERTNEAPSIFDVLKPLPASHFAPPARVQEKPGGPWRNVSDEELQNLAPLTILRNVLPTQTASKLLDQLRESSLSWKPSKWIVHGKEHLTPRKTAVIKLSDDHEETTDEATTSNNIQPDGNASEEMRMASQILTSAVSKIRPWSQWKPTYVLANRYANGSECVGWHSDHIMELGPRPIIVGLSLGAARRFDLRHDNNKRHVSVVMPHNSAVVMWNDAQESWHHSVPRCSDDSIRPQHPTVGLTRFSLTFRMKRKLPTLGNCHCGLPAALKAKQGKYYLFCKPYGKDKHATCNFWKPCIWAENEAAYLANQDLEAASAAAAAAVTSLPLTTPSS